MTDSGLFLPGHKDYKFTVTPPEHGMVYPKKHDCPFCRKHFEKDVPRQSNMHLVKTDPDLRNHYKGIEPHYFEIVTCPSCCFSAVTSQFEKAETSDEDKLFAILSPHRGKFDFSGTAVTDLNTMFAGYYLAALCAPVSFPGSDTIAAHIWHRLSWLYGDCEDTELCETTGKKALGFYVSCFQNAEMPEEQMIRIQLIIAELSYRCGDMKTASEFFMKVRVNKKAGAVYQQLADDRIAEIRQK